MTLMNTGRTSVFNSPSIKIIGGVDGMLLMWKNANKMRRYRNEGDKFTERGHNRQHTTARPTLKTQKAQVDYTTTTHTRHPTTKN